VVNASDEAVTLKASTTIGELTEAQLANEQFDHEVKNYVPLNLKLVKKLAALNLQSNGKFSQFHTNKPCKQPQITTNDMIDHEIRTKVRKLNTGKKLNTTQREELFQVLLKNKSAFQWNEQLGCTRLVEHSVPTGVNKPIVQHQYTIPNVCKPFCETQVKEMLEQKVIRPSQSCWRSPVLLAKKKTPDGGFKYRFCIDLKKVNAITTKDCYALPLIKDTVDSLSGCKFFTTLDVDRAFWQVPVKEEDRCKLAFVIDGKLYEFNVMPFGSMNAPGTFQRLIDRVLKGLTWRQCLVYIDDVLIFSKSFDQHLLDIDEVLARFTYAGLKLKPSKCLFANDQVEYLGFTISSKGIQISNKKIEAVLNVKPPETNKILFSFLCSMNYYRSLIPRFGELTASLYKLAESKTRKCNWSKDTLEKFNKLKLALTSAPILAFPDFGRPFYIQTDASQVALSGVLLQEHNGIFRPVAFASRKLTDTETRYSATEREMLGINYAYEQFFNTVYGRKIIFYTDHKPLVTSEKLKNPMGRLANMFFKLTGVDYTIRHIKGEENHLPDFLSRVKYDETKEIKVNLTGLQSSINWKEEQAKDLNISKVLQLLNSNNWNNDKIWKDLIDGSRWLLDKAELYADNGILVWGKGKIVVPNHLIKEILIQHHDTPFSGHRAAETTLASIKSRYHWNYMSRDIRNYCQTCELCQKFNYATLHPKAPLQSIQVTRPFQLIGFDFMGPFKTSGKGNAYIIIAIDHFTKFAVGAATKSFDAQTTAEFIFTEIVCKLGMMERMLSDQGVNFEANVIKHLCKLLGTDKLHSSTYHAPGNGITERVNKSIKPALAKCVNDSHDDWDIYLPMAISAYNNSQHASIQMTPYEALFGRPSVLVSDVIMNNQLPANTRIKDISDFTFGLRRAANRINQMILDNTTAARQRQKDNYDKFLHNKEIFMVGDKVKINNVRKLVGLSKAFSAKFLGPYTITKCINDLVYVIQAPGVPDEVVHYNRLFRFYSRDVDVAPPVLVSKQNSSPSTFSDSTVRDLHVEQNESSSLIAENNINLIQLKLVLSLKSIRDRANKHKKSLNAAEQLVLKEQTMTNFLATIERVVKNYPRITENDYIMDRLNRETFSRDRNDFLNSIRTNAAPLLAIEAPPVPIILDATVVSNANADSSDEDDYFDGQEGNATLASIGNLSDSDSDATSVPGDSVVQPTNVYNEKGKLCAECPTCHNFFEKTRGVGLHRRTDNHCKQFLFPLGEVVTDNN